MEDSPQSSWPISPERWPVLWLPLSMNDHHTTISRTVTCAAVATFIERPPHNNIPNGDLYCGCHFHRTITTQVCAETIHGAWSTTFDPVWPQEGSGNEDILASVCNWTQRYWHETMPQSMCFVVGMISGRLVSWESSLFRWMCSLLQLPV